MHHRRTTIIVLAAIAAVLLGAVVYLTARAGQHATRAYLPACATEDSTNCIWDAATQGNGRGQSLINWHGATYVEVTR